MKKNRVTIPALFLIFLTVCSCGSGGFVLWDENARAVLEQEQVEQADLVRFFASGGMNLGFHDYLPGEDLGAFVDGRRMKVILFMPSYYNEVRALAATRPGLKPVMIGEPWDPDKGISSLVNDKLEAVTALGFLARIKAGQNKLDRLFFYSGKDGPRGNSLLEAFRGGLGDGTVLEEAVYRTSKDAGVTELLRGFVSGTSRIGSPEKSLVIILDAASEKDIWNELGSYTGRIASDLDLASSFSTQAVILKPEFSGEGMQLAAFLAEPGNGGRINIPWGLFIRDWQWQTFR